MERQMANATLSTIAAVLEELYVPADAQDHIIRNNPVLGMIPHTETAGGKYKHYPVKYVRPQGRSNGFSEASSNAQPTQRVAFDVTWVSNYQLGGIDGDVIDDARGNKVMLVDHVQSEIDGAMDNLADDIAFNLFNNGGGARGQVGSGTASPITLANPSDAAHFEVGMVLTASTDDGTGSGTDRSGTGTITDIDRDTGIITYTGTITSIAPNDYLFVEGDQGAKMSGIPAWVPDTTPSATTFFGVDRTADPVRLAGVRYDANSAGDDTKDALVNLVHRILRFKKGSRPNLAVLNPIDYAALDILLEGDKRYTELKSPNGSVGYDAIQLNVPGGHISVISDVNCPESRLYELDTTAWEFCTAGAMVRLLEEDGSMMLRQSSADGYEFRIKSRGNFACKVPGNNGVALL